MESSRFAQFVLYAWVPICTLLFFRFSTHRAIIIALLFSHLFLPEGKIELPGIPDLDKLSATSVGLMLGVIFAGSGGIDRFRITVWDLPIMIFCFEPYISSTINDYGAWDALSSVIGQFLHWGIPYFIGRIYLNTHRAQRELLWGIALAGIVYLPFCWYELRMSPQLHRMIYGYAQHSFSQVIRFGGFRPMVFMPHGLVLSLWMGFSTISAYVLYRRGLFKHLFGFSAPIWIALLGLTTIACKSVNAVSLLAVGFGILICPQWLQKLGICALLLAGPLYVTTRSINDWGVEGATEFVATYIQPERAASLQTRFDNESMLRDKALQKPYFGWGGHGESRVKDKNGKDISITDGLWIIILGSYGCVGLIAIIGVFVLPALKVYVSGTFNFSHQYRYNLASPVLALFLLLLMINSLFNTGVPHIILATMGSLVGLTVHRHAEDQLTRAHPAEAFQFRIL